MGIYISLNVSKSVTAEEWKPVYEKSLLMAQKAGLYDIGFRMIHGERINCIYMTEEIVPDDEKEEIRQRRYTGWSAVGSIPSYCRAETQFMPKYTRGNEEGEKTDALLSIVSDADDNLWWQVWGNKTQGEPYHMVLLAIGCMAEQELGIQAIVDGDITYGQCVSAARLASELLETEIKPPIRCRWVEFADRVKKLKGLDDTGKLEFLMQYYLGRKDNNMGEYIRSHFSDDVILSFWQKRFQNIKINTYGFQDEMKTFFYLVMIYLCSAQSSILIEMILSNANSSLILS